jgi:hypothetical protein
MATSGKRTNQSVNLVYMVQQPEKPDKREKLNNGFIMVYVTNGVRFCINTFCIKLEGWQAIRLEGYQAIRLASFQTQLSLLFVFYCFLE